MFFVIEGIDGAGCETQAKAVYNSLIREFVNKKCYLIKYPDYSKNVGKFIKEFLYENKNLTAGEQFLLYSLQFLMDKQWIAKKRKKEIILADRYFSTTLCFQTLEGVSLNKALRFADDFEIEKPDVIFYLDVDPNIAINRKFGEQKEKNRREKDFDFIRKTYRQYEMLVDKQIWAQWIRIDGNKGIEEITKDIYNLLISKIKY
jgi:dTMP kinase